MKTEKSWSDALAAIRSTLVDNESFDCAKSVADTPNCDRDIRSHKITVTLFYERKGRGGRSATIITGLDELNDDELQVLASDLKKKLACGGSAREGEILVQGDRRIELRNILVEKGFSVKG